MRIGRFSFRPRILATLAAAAFIALTVSLGRWQVGRGEEKAARQAQLESRQREAPVRLTGPVASAEPLMYRHVTARGEWIPARQVFVDNQIRDGRAGFHVVTPLKLAGGNAAVLVNRGWIPRDARYPQAPAVEVPQGTAEIAGVATRPPERFLELSAQTITGDVWQNLSIERYRQHTGLDVLPVVVNLEPASPGLATVREAPDAGIAKHREYALTWFSLAVTAFALWLVLNLRRESP